MRADASFAVPVKLWALLCVFAGVMIGGNVLLTCILTGGALLYLVMQRNFRLAASYGCFYLLLALLLYGIRFHGLRMPIFSEFYVLMFWNLSPIFLVSWDLITTPPGIPLSSRLLQIDRDMEELIHTFQPDEMAVEELFFTKNITTGIAVAHGRGVILLSAERLGVPVFEYTPMQVKQAVAGYGGADKRQVMLMTQRLLNMKQVPRPDDAADALALAICHGRAATSLLNTERVFDPMKYDTR